MEKHYKFSIWYVLFAVWIVLILQNMIVQFFSVERVPYSEFIKALEAGKVMEVAVMQDRLQGKMKVKKDIQETEKVFSTVCVDPDLSELLEKYNVSFKGVVERIIAGLEKKNRLINEMERKIVSYHEIGHALVALSLPGTDPVRKVSIIPRGVAALGYTLQVPTEDRFLMSKSELLNKIAVALGGRAAEEIKFNDISTGAHNDLARATDIARSMVKEYGMSPQLDHIYFEKERRQQYFSIWG